MRKMIGKIKAWINSIRTQILLIMIITNVIIIGLLSLGAFQYYKESFVEEIGTNRSDVLSQIADRVKSFKTNAYTVSNLYYYDDLFRQYTQNLTKANEKEFMNYMDELTSQYKVSFHQINLDFYVVYLSRNGVGYCSDHVPDNYDYMNPEIKIWYSDLYNARGDIVDVACYRDKMLNINSFCAARTVLDEQGEIIGYLMINIDERQIYDTYQDVISSGSNIYIADDKGSIVSSNVSGIIGFDYFNMNNLKEMFGEKVYIITKNTNRTALFTKNYEPVSGFTVFEEIELHGLLTPILRVENMVIIFALLALMFGLAMAWTASKQISSPIIRLEKHIQNVEAGNLDEVFQVHGYTEITALNDGMQSMLMRIRSLMEREKEKEEQKRKIEMNLLQAQINPHFMYNTLFSVKCMVDMEENEKASEMISLFIQLLRSTLSNPEEMDTVEAQMEVIKQYIDLQKFRYAEGFDAIVEYDESIANKKLPKLLIQPLVENAIFHGLESSGSDRLIIVIVRPFGKDICIEVEDNGIGMTEEMVDKMLKEEIKTDRPHIGIKNVNDRIKLRFGDQYGLSIESTVNVGTKIKIMVPAID
ncbi:MAG TPA: histidine kinase [Candidatus Merdenecus merdavium]|nr:histidine kinase [Candidatus Merdenecus merdavium]